MEKSMFKRHKIKSDHRVRRKNKVDTYGALILTKQSATKYQNVTNNLLRTRANPKSQSLTVPSVTNVIKLFWIVM